MATPMPTPMTTTTTTVDQLVQQQLEKQQAEQSQKPGASKFDGVLAEKTKDAATAEATRVIQETQAADKVGHVRKASEVQSAQGKEGAKDPSAPDNALRADAVKPTEKAQPSKAVTILTQLVSDLEVGEKHIDKMIKGGMGSRNLNNTDLLRMQAAMYKYTQELELTGKVVEKATTGLKDTLKTQV
jgi:hypothetical protein